MTDSQLLNTYRYQSGSFYTTLPGGVGQPASGILAYKSGFPGLLAGRPHFFWLQESSNINLQTLVFSIRSRWRLHMIEFGEFSVQAGDNVIGSACDFLPTVEQNGVSVEYYPETYEYHAAFSIQGNVATLAESPTVPDYIDPPPLTYAWGDPGVVQLIQGNFDLVAV